MRAILLVTARRCLHIRAAQISISCIHTVHTFMLKGYTLFPTTNSNRGVVYRYQVAREIRMHSQLLHENIVRLYCAWKDSQFIHVAEEYAPHGDIFSLLKPRNSMAAVGVAENFVVVKVCVLHIHRSCTFFYSSM